MLYQSKDFIQTDQGLLFAVVSDRIEDGRVLCFLRYALNNQQWRKVNTDQANAHLAKHYPQYLYHSKQLDTDLHAVPETLIVRHYQPKIELHQLLSYETNDVVVKDLQALCRLLQNYQIDLEHLGVTGSLLVGMQNAASDMDLICYDRATFHEVRSVIRIMLDRDQCQNLNHNDWLNTYHRRACDFALDDYIWHEQRKYNKAIFNQRKFDWSLLAVPRFNQTRQYQKVGHVQIRALVTDDTLGFDYPAQFDLEYPDIESVVCFTATYTGQARTGELVEVAGQLEIDDQGRQYIVVGSSREALGEFIRVLH